MNDAEQKEKEKKLSEYMDVAEDLQDKFNESLLREKEFHEVIAEKEFLLSQKEQEMLTLRQQVAQA